MLSDSMLQGDQPGNAWNFYFEGQEEPFVGVSGWIGRCATIMGVTGASDGMKRD